MRNRKRLVLVAVVGLVGCGGDQRGEREQAELKSRMAALEKRVAGIEQAVEPVERLRDDAASVDRRLSVVETALRELGTRLSGQAEAPAPAGTPPATRPPAPPAGARSMPSGPAAWGGPTTREDREGRRAQLRLLQLEFRSRLAQLRDERGDEPSVEHQRKIQEVLAWYREQRRAIIRGEAAAQ